ncbi:MAG: ABC transporter substrate-binding protein [Verrucomicrobia bacterium]|nr:ABC transporter substrate-binding protein [Verrucomicrobiota bacterium]
MNTSSKNASTAELAFGFMALTDAAPLIVAHEKGLFREQGLNVTLRRAASWTGLRDAVNKGETHGAQMLFSMPVASACGLLGINQKPLIIPWVLSRNGQAITLHNTYKGKVAADAKNLRDAAIEGRDSGRPLVFGHTLRVGTHALWLRYWLAAGGIHPGNDVALITVPPAQMVSNMRSARMDGFCSGEPWNARAVAEELGYTATTSQEIWPDHPEKVFAFTEEFAQQHPTTVVASLKALYQAGIWLDDPANRNEAAALLARPEYLDCDPAWITARLGELTTYGDGRTAPNKHPMSFARGNASRPRASHAIWILTQFRRWGLHYGKPDYAGLAARVIRPDFYETALKELGVAPSSPFDGPETLFDGKVFDPTRPEVYATSFNLHNLIN